VYRYRKWYCFEDILHVSQDLGPFQKRRGGKKKQKVNRREGVQISKMTN
jgi:hypothetical protein